MKYKFKEKYDTVPKGTEVESYYNDNLSSDKVFVKLSGNNPYFLVPLDILEPIVINKPKFDFDNILDD